MSRTFRRTKDNEYRKLGRFRGAVKGELNFDENGNIVIPKRHKKLMKKVNRQFSLSY